MNPGHPSQGSGSCEQRGWVRPGGTLPRTQPRPPRLSLAPGGPPGPSQTRPGPPFASRTCSAPRTPRCLERRRLPSSAPSPFKNRRPALAPPPPRPQETCQRRDRSTGRREDHGSCVFRTHARHIPQREVPTGAWAVGRGRHGLQPGPRAQAPVLVPTTGNGRCAPGDGASQGRPAAVPRREPQPGAGPKTAAPRSPAGFSLFS